jgi:hypothetical protein
MEPGGFAHYVQRPRLRVDRPYYMIVPALTDNARFHEGEFSPSPAPTAFRFWS